VIVTTDGSTSDVEGVVGRVNERGVLLEGREGWLNISKFAGGVVLPEPGARVRLSLDNAGFIRGIETLAAPAPLGQEDGSALAGFPVSVASVRDVRIMRQAVLNTATAILSSGGRATDAAAVIALAEELEAWVTRGP
jgi:hypothetical protein